ncbi:hypothetical protein [Streptomyces sp. Z26]|uniref:hypothetical protein n=1 Tax=Streptomyces sp. Z26 TaxID=2500177 RepID=UPI000EF159E0|nr:hypothetical protein [Streptomyces sp. Z26]RLL67881.1 hypothetical protein D7M15_14690 [Streptomyces sp. Z26]
MQMNSAPHLLVEDRPEFERVLDEALRTARRRTGPATTGPRLNDEQLRTMALDAAEPIAACAAAEYARFTALRDDLRQRVDAPSYGAGSDPRPDPGTGTGAGTDDGGDGSGGGGARDAGAAGLGLAGAMTAGLTDTAGAGAVAMVSVLAPLLAGTAACIFLIVGYALHMLSPEPALAAALRNAGWAFAVLAAATALAGMAGLLLAAVRNGASSVRAPVGAVSGGHDPHGGLAAEVAEARDAWRTALRDRGVEPFLRDALDGPSTAPARTTGPALPDTRGGAPDEHRTPRLGYSHPSYSSPASRSPGETDTTTRPRFSSPDYSSPDYGGPEHAPE